MSRIVNRLKKHDADICIYGFGKNGVVTFWSLKEFGLSQDYFADKDPGKCNLGIKTVDCISYDELLAKPRNIILIIAIEKSKDLIKAFKELGFKNVYDYRKVLRALKKQHTKKYKVIKTYDEACEVQRMLQNWLLSGEEPRFDILFERDR